VCNATLPCLFEILSDPSESTNVAADHPETVERLVAAVDAANKGTYVSGSLDAAVLASKYVEVDPHAHWRGFLGPCYLRRDGA
jgi:hypothetical protein